MTIAECQARHELARAEIVEPVRVVHFAYVLLLLGAIGLEFRALVDPERVAAALAHLVFEVAGVREIAVAAQRVRGRRRRDQQQHNEQMACHASWMPARDLRIRVSTSGASSNESS